MDKKLLICGSSIAVVVLVLASFSPVVGYNSVESSAKESPLFNIRTKRAIDEESETLTCNYLRKGQLMSFPSRNSKIIEKQKLMEYIKSMDDKAFNSFVAKVITFARRDTSIGEKDINEVILSLQQLRAKQKIQKDSLVDNNVLVEEDLPIFQATLFNWRPLCIFWKIYDFITALTVWIYWYVTEKITSVPCE